MKNSVNSHSRSRLIGTYAVWAHSVSCVVGCDCLYTCLCLARGPSLLLFKQTALSNKWLRVVLFLRSAGESRSTGGR